MKDVNEWVSQQTGRKVQHLLTKPFPRSPGVNTVSAAYFKGTPDLPQQPRLNERLLMATGRTAGFSLLTGKWLTRFGRSGAVQNFQVDGGAPVRVPMMQQDNYPVKMGADSDLSCTVSEHCVKLRCANKQCARR